MFSSSFCHCILSIAVVTIFPYSSCHWTLINKKSFTTFILLSKMGRDFKRDSYRKYLGFWYSAKSHFVEVKNPKRKGHEQIEFCDECLKEAFEQSTSNSPEACDLLLNANTRTNISSFVPFHL